MQSSVVTRNGRTKLVKNLGWLLRNWKLVERFEVEPHGRTEGGGLQPDAILTAYLKDGGRYSTGFADDGVLADFLHRPVFDTLRVRWYGKDRVIGEEFAKEFGR